MAAKKKENEDRLEQLEFSNSESMQSYQTQLIEIKEKHQLDISRLELDQQEKIEADSARS